VVQIDRAVFEDLIRGKSRGIAASLARAGLGMAAVPYRIAVVARNLAFDRGWKQIHRSSIPVVSVGNLTLGGTGKTPMVEWVARWYRRRGVRVALISRGYGQSEGLNDEGQVLDENLPDVPHLQDPDRVAMARIAAEELESELIVLDDGFQHRRLARDVDIVLLDALEPFGYRRIFPRGLLREPLHSIRRASIVVLSRADLISTPERAAIHADVERYAGSRQLRWAEAHHAPIDLVDCDSNSEPIEGLKGRKVVAFCGIGNPEGFRRTLEPLCNELIDLKTFPDHHLYNARDVDLLRDWAAQSGADLVLTTQKDLVKLRTSSLGKIPLRALRIGLEVLEGEADLEAVLAPLLPSTS